MNAVVMREFGGPEVLKSEEIAKPEYAADEIRVEIKAASVNPIDWKLRSGMMQGIWDIPLPAILGVDYSGIVEAVGDEVNEFKRGDEVICYSRSPGGYAQYAVCPAENAVLKPKEIGFIDAAALPVVALTAWQALFDNAGLQSGQTVLVHAAAGGVGTMAVQLAHWKGAKVIGTASAHNHEFLQELGADELIDYNTTRFEDVVKDVDVVFDTMGGDVQKRSYQVLKQGGFLITVVSPPDPADAERFGVRSGYFSCMPKKEQLEAVANLVVEGKLQPIIETVLSINEAAKAHEMGEKKHTRGKIILTP